MKKYMIAALVFFSAQFAFAHEPVFDVCEKQIRGYIASNLEANVTNIDIFYGTGEGSAQNGTAWVSTDSCSGSYVFELFANEMDCSIPHYGEIPNYIQYVWSTGDCRL